MYQSYNQEPIRRPSFNKSRSQQAADYVLDSFAKRANKQQTSLDIIQDSFKFFAKQPSTPVSNSNNSNSNSIDNVSQSIKTETVPDPFVFSAGLKDVNNMAASEVWSPAGQSAPHTSMGRALHQRESSLSSLGSTGPASPYSHHSSNPKIAAADSLPDSYTNMSLNDEQFLQLAKSMNSSSSAESFSANYPIYAAEPTSAAAIVAYASLLAAQKSRNEKSVPHGVPEFHIGNSGSRPTSVASSLGSDSPATPDAREPEADKRRRLAFSNVPKLDRTMTDIYSDELYNPDFTITSATPSQQVHNTSVSPSNEIFAQRLQAANSQHINTQSPTVASTARVGSPFRRGSPLAPISHNFATATPSSLQYGSAQLNRQQSRPDTSGQRAARHPLPSAASEVASMQTQTISPKDAILEFNDAGTSSNMPLFPPQESASFNTTPSSSMPRAPLQRSDSSNSQRFANYALSGAGFDELVSRLPSSIQVPQHYPFVPQSSHVRTPSATSSMSRATPMSRNNSSDSATSYSSFMARPETTAADGGTYTCTYHGCTLRFESPSALQKHKREGHRQAPGMTSAPKPEIDDPASLLNSQAGPHRCDRVNPSTGKPCATIFSRPYDLTRHEDTIHNARKQKVRCELCTEEKTFSRADALTRHFRVCHPDVDFPGKHRKRGGGSNI